MSGFGWEQKTFNLTKMFVCVYMQCLFPCLENLTLCSLEIITMLQNVSAFTSTYTAEDLSPFFSVLFKDGRTHSVFQEMQIKSFFCNTCLELASVYLYVYECSIGR